MKCASRVARIAQSKPGLTRPPRRGDALGRTRESAPKTPDASGAGGALGREAPAAYEIGGRSPPRLPGQRRNREGVRRPSERLLFDAAMVGAGVPRGACRWIVR